MPKKIPFLGARPLYPLPMARIVPPASVTIGSLLACYADELFTKRQDPQAEIHFLHEFFAAVLATPVATIDLNFCGEVIRAHSSSSTGEINRAMQGLRALLYRAVVHKQLSRNPMSDWQPLEGRVPDNRSFTPEQRHGLYVATLEIETRYRDACTQQDARRVSYGHPPSICLTAVPLASPVAVDIVFTMATGIMPGTSCALTRLPLDLRAGLLLLPLKAGLPDRPYPLTETMQRFAGAWLAHHATATTLPRPTGKLSHYSAWQSVRRHVTGVRWLDLRRDFGDQMTALGAPLWQVRYLLGLTPLDDPFPDPTPAMFNALRASLALRETQCPLTLAQLEQMAS